ncbi:amino acid ABC transporter permease [Pseudaminobacter soli (ex Li et al. 2025)]|uniref:Amino acid ABC transporter permease n=1 Tax=Pseudaminobacter soli (ex Li et al. 2025) TaxID=1295366 RepID=A0A2P7S929_9HYPH|nr:amino acid ABC transporter permease [Mesorhizobium soli]PSJ58993.1 amino acid ABC transporter permease [Mesorhizobium soli]
MQFLMRLRPSNLIIAAALPFIVYLFGSSADYSRSLRAILGVEHGSSAAFLGFLALAVAFATGLGTVLFTRVSMPRWRLATACVVLNLVAAVLVAMTDLVRPYASSIVANAVDPFTSKLIVQGVTPRQLMSDAEAMVHGYTAALAWTYLALTIIASALLFLGGLHGKAGPARGISRMMLIVFNGLGLAIILFIAPMAFAAGVATTVRAAVAAYILAALLGLVWVGLLKLQYSARAELTFVALPALLACAAAWFLFQPREGYALVGAFGGKVAVVSGTPSGMIGAVRFGQFPGAPEDELPLRTFKGSAEAIQALATKADVSAALLPATSVPADLPVQWHTEALNDRDKAAGITLAVMAIVLGLLTFGGHIHRRHPLSIGSEFIIDTIRGIPMLVIVLYVGLPLAGAMKDATQGIFDPPNLARGIAAMALAYSAYLAEIFRSGINAIPRGQIEAARSLGLNGWKTARLVVLPQAFRIIIPPLGNELIAILKDTSLLSILSIRDVTQRMREFQSASFLPFAPYNSAAIFYILLTLAAASLVNSFERKYDIKHR